MPLLASHLCYFLGIRLDRGQNTTSGAESRTNVGRTGAIAKTSSLLMHVTVGVGSVYAHICATI